MAELNTLAPMKWSGNYSGAAPTLDTSDGVNIGDVARDTSNGMIWTCFDNTESAPVWRTNTTGSFDYTVAAGDYADLRDAVEGGSYATVFVPNGTYVVADNEARPLTVHANCKLIAGQSRDGTLIDADSLANITDVLYGHPTLQVCDISITNNSYDSTRYAFRGQVTQASGITESPVAITKFINCAVIGFTAGGYNNVGFRDCMPMYCYVDGCSYGNGYYLCYNCDSCLCVDPQWLGFNGCIGISNSGVQKRLNQNANYACFYQCSTLTGCQAGQMARGYCQCTSISACSSGNCDIGFDTCSSIMGCYAHHSTTYGFSGCTDIIAPTTYLNSTDFSTSSVFKAPPSTAATGDMLYYDGANWALVPAGTASQQLRMNATATAPEWFTP